MAEVVRPRRVMTVQQTPLLLRLVVVIRLLLQLLLGLQPLQLTTSTTAKSFLTTVRVVVQKNSAQPHTLISHYN